MRLACVTLIKFIILNTQKVQTLFLTTFHPYIRLCSPNSHMNVTETGTKAGGGVVSVRIQAVCWPLLLAGCTPQAIPWPAQGPMVAVSLCSLFTGAKVPLRETPRPLLLSLPFL